MSDNRLWLWDRSNGLAARVATFVGYKWEMDEANLEHMQKLFNLDEPSKELELIWEGDKKNWVYGPVDPETGLRRITPKTSEEPEWPDVIGSGQGVASEPMTMELARSIVEQ